MIPEGWPAPVGEYEVNVQTEFHADPEEDEEGCTHTRNCNHSCIHTRKGYGELFVDGQKVDPLSPFHQVYQSVIEVW